MYKKKIAVNIRACPMPFLKKKIHWSTVCNQLGLVLHVPGIAAGFSLLICFFFREWFAVAPLIATALLSIGLGQLLYRCFSKKAQHHLWDAMLIAALGWLVCSFLSAIPLWWIAVNQLHAGASSETLVIFSHPINAIFESFSGLTSTGLTLMDGRGFFPYTLQWWRSILQWIGGIGLIAFILSLVHLNRDDELYYAEAHTERLTRDMMKTTQWIWGIYSLYTFAGMLLFFCAGMPLWQAINHAMTVIATGGFTIIGSHFSDYNITIQWIALLLMIMGAISFSIHCCIIRHRHWKLIGKNLQLRLLFIFLAIGSGILFLFDLWNQTGNRWLDTFFEWTSALTTCGFATLSLNAFSPMAKLFLILGMITGGMTGSTAGGLKIRRIADLFSAIFLRLVSITKKKEKTSSGEKNSLKPFEEELPKTPLPRSGKSEQLLTAEVLFSLWIMTLGFGWLFVLKWAPANSSLNALFDVTSALSNVGLTSGIFHSELPIAGKCLFMVLMWIGRLEMIPALVLFLSLPFSLHKKRAKKCRQQQKNI